MSAPAVQGRMRSEDALRRLLAGSGLTYVVADDRTVAIEKPGGDGAGGATVLDPITVEGQGGTLPPSQDPARGYKADFASTATRVTIPIQETPSSINVVTEDLIDDTFSRLQGDAFEAVSGVTRAIRRDGRGENVVIRGFRYVFGEVVGAIKSNGLSGTSRFAPDAALVERYEVLKGPASIVGGATRPGGTINRISKRPTAERQAVAQVEAGSFDFYRGLADVSGAVTDNNAVRVRFIAAAETGGEYVDQVDAQQFTISPSLEVDTFDGAGTLFLTGYYQRFDGSSYAGGPLLQDGSIPGNAPTVNLGCLDADVCGAFTEAEIKNVEVHYDHDIVDNLAMSLKGRYLKSEITTLELSPFGNTNNETSIWAGYSPLNGTTYTGEASLKKGFAAFGGNHEILGGVDYLKTESESGTSWMFLGQQSITDPQIVYSVSPSDFGPLSLRETTLKQASVFGQAVLRPLDRVTFVGGIRNDWVDISNINVSMTNERTESELTYRAGASVRVFDFMNVYAGYQQSFLPNSTATDQSGALLPSETGQNYEVGAKFDILDGNMSLTTALFRTYRQNVATPDPDAPPGSTASVSNGEERARVLRWT